MASHVQLLVDLTAEGAVELRILDEQNVPIAHAHLPREGHVDNTLLTAVDEMLKKSSLDRSALTVVRLGDGIDKNSSLYRIVQSFSSAVHATSGGSGGLQETAESLPSRGGSVEEAD